MKFLWSCDHCKMAGQVEAGGTFDAIDRAREAHAAISDCQWRGLDVRPPYPAPAHDSVDHPSHYNTHPSGVECIDIAEHYGFAIGNCIKYLWRAGLKGDAIEDLCKARWYLDREIQRREKEAKP